MNDSPSSPLIRRQTHSREIAGWDDPLREARPWIVPVECEAVAPLRGLAGIESIAASKLNHSTGITVRILPLDDIVGWDTSLRRMNVMCPG
jgi:hypothetical protein